MTNKMTKKDALVAIEEIVKVSGAKNAQELVEFCQHERELLANKASKTKPTKTQARNAELAPQIVEFIKASETPVSIPTILKEFPTYEEGTPLTNQRVSAILKPFIGTDITKVYEKKVVHFKAYTGEDEEVTE